MKQACYCSRGQRIGLFPALILVRILSFHFFLYISIRAHPTLVMVKMIMFQLKPSDIVTIFIELRALISTGSCTVCWDVLDHTEACL